MTTTTAMEFVIHSSSSCLQSYDWPSVNEETLKNLGKYIKWTTSTNITTTEQIVKSHWYLIIDSSLYKESPYVIHHNCDHWGMTTSYHWTMLSCGRQEINYPWIEQMLHTFILLGLKVWCSREEFSSDFWCLYLCYEATDISCYFPS